MLVCVVSGARVLPGPEEEIARWLISTIRSLQVSDDEPVVLIQGGAEGVDSLAIEIGATPPITDLVTAHALWDQHGLRAGPRRNALMLGLATGLSASKGARAVLLAVPGPRSKGTWSAIDMAIKREVRTLVLSRWANPDRVAKYQESLATQEKFGEWLDGSGVVK